MLSKVHSLGLAGIAGYGVETECYIGTGLPAFELVGLPDASVKEARERVRAAVKNCGFRFPVSRIIVNLAPAGTKKSGTLYDLPILLGILCASEQVRLPKEKSAFLGELSLQGGLRSVPGVLPMALAARALGYQAIYVPAANAREATLAEGLTVYTTYRIVKELYGEAYAQEHYIDQWQQAVNDYYLDFYVRNPDYLANLPEDKQLEITGNLTYVRQYCEMPLKILKAEQLVGGEDAFDQILNRLFNRELDPMYPYLTYQDFLNACGLAEEDLNLD